MVNWIYERVEEDIGDSSSIRRTGRGWVTLLGREYLLRLTLSSDLTPISSSSSTGESNLKGMTRVGRRSLRERGMELEGDVVLSKLLKEYSEVVEKYMDQFTDFDEFWSNLNQFMERQLHDPDSLPPSVKRLQRAKLLPPSNPTITTNNLTKTLPTYFSHVIEDLERIGWDNIESLSPDMDEVQFKLKDSHNRSHLVSWKYPPQYPLTSPTIELIIPNFTPNLLNLPPTLAPTQTWWDYLKPEIIKILDKFHPFWLVMDELDSGCLILEPHPVNRSHLHRRLSLDPLCSIELEIHPDHPHAIPNFRLYGPTRRLAPFKDNLEHHLSLWDLTLTPKLNLERILKISLPTGWDQSTDHDPHQECGICYSYQVASQPSTTSTPTTSIGTTPALICDNSACHTPFHHSCLLESIKSLPTSRRSYQVWFGQCPYCNEPITVTEP